MKCERCDKSGNSDVDVHFRRDDITGFCAVLCNPCGNALALAIRSMLSDVDRLKSENEQLRGAAWATMCDTIQGQRDEARRENSRLTIENSRLLADLTLVRARVTGLEVELKAATSDKFLAKRLRELANAAEANDYGAVAFREAANCLDYSPPEPPTP